jgi:hypothetical protein
MITTRNRDLVGHSMVLPLPAQALDLSPCKAPGRPYPPHLRLYEMYDMIFKNTIDSMISIQVDGTAVPVTDTGNQLKSKYV